MAPDSEKQVQKLKRGQSESFQRNWTLLRKRPHMVSATFPFIEFAADTVIRCSRTPATQSRTLTPRKPQYRRCGGSEHLLRDYSFIIMSLNFKNFEFIEIDD